MITTPVAATASFPAQRWRGTDGSNPVSSACDSVANAAFVVLNCATPVLLDLRINQLAEMLLEPLVRSLLIRSHEPRVAGHIGGKDRGEAAAPTRSVKLWQRSCAL